MTDHATWAETHARDAYKKAMAETGPRPEDATGGALWHAEVLARASEAIHFPDAAFRSAFDSDVPPGIRAMLRDAEERFRENGVPQ